MLRSIPKSKRFLEFLSSQTIALESNLYFTSISNKTQQTIEQVLSGIYKKRKKQQIEENIQTTITPKE